MVARISDLERLLASAKKDWPLPARECVTEQPGAQPSPDVSKDKEKLQGNFLVQKGSSSQYFSEVLLSRVIEEVLHPSGRATDAPQLYRRFQYTTRTRIG